MCLLERVAVDGSQINVGPSLWLHDVPTEIYYREKMRSPSSGGGEDLILLSANMCAAPDRRNWLERHLFEDEDKWVTKGKPRLELVGFFALDYAQRGSMYGAGGPDGVPIRERDTVPSTGSAQAVPEFPA